ncbi:hypothetical protein AB4Y42_43100, partial [Paraburkholderia sp. EG286B]|uniref:hypothetical protein n=1 Tax=Paraburkholderia sp. EG286B TaxID=3237011 RepID=UPI0034D320ED
KQTLSERVGAAHNPGESGGPSINASRTLRDDVLQRYFSSLLDMAIEWGEKNWKVRAFATSIPINLIAMKFVAISNRRPGLRCSCLLPAS